MRVAATAETTCSGDFQRAYGNRCGPAVSVVSCKGECAAAVVSQRSAAGDNTRERLVVCARVDEGSVVDNVLRVAAAAETTCGGDFQRARIDRCGAAVGIVAGNGEGAATVVSQRSAAGNDTRERLVVCARVDEGPIVEDALRVAAAAETTCGGNFQRARVDRGGAAVGIVACEGGIAA